MFDLFGEIAEGLLLQDATTHGLDLDIVRPVFFQRSLVGGAIADSHTEQCIKLSSRSCIRQARSNWATASDSWRTSRSDRSPGDMVPASPTPPSAKLPAFFSPAPTPA